MVSDKVLLLGASGFIGRHLFERLGPEEAIATFRTHDLTGGIYFDAQNIKLAHINDVASVSHAVILLGESNIEKCALDPHGSRTLNVSCIKTIIDDLFKLKIKPVFISSDAVFDGNKGNYIESDPVNPILAYGKQKVEIEDHLKGSEHLIIRLAKVIGNDSHDETLFSHWLKEIKAGRLIRCAFDQVFSPIYIDDVVEGILRIIKTNNTGTYHLSNYRAYSRVELLEMLLKRLNPMQSDMARFERVSINALKLIEKRPLNTSLNPSKIVKATNLEITGMEMICDRLVREIS